MANNIEAEITLTTQEGVSVPIKIIVEWPENYGYYALGAINRLEEFKNDLGEAALQQVVANGDTSLLAHLPDEEDN